MGDERLIQQVLARYARAVDRRDADAVAALYTPDGIERLSWHDRGTRTVMATFQGQAEIRHAVSTFLAPHAPHAWAHHMTFDPIVTITGDTATLDAQFVVVEVDGATRTITPAHAGYYELKLRRHDGEWRIVENDTILDLAPARLDASRGVLQVPFGSARDREQQSHEPVTPLSPRTVRSVTAPPSQATPHATDCPVRARLASRGRARIIRSVAAPERRLEDEAPRLRSERVAESVAAVVLRRRYV